MVTLPSFTDNQGVAKALAKLMTTKFPLCCVVMELAAQMEQRGCWIDLTWTPRELNQEADDLSNLRTGSFDESLRVPIDLVNSGWLVLDRTLEQGRDFFAGLAELRARRKQSASAAVQAGLGAGRKRRRRPGEALRNREPW